MTVNLLHYTPLWVCSTAIRKCWASEDKSDTKFLMEYDDDGVPRYDEVSRGEHSDYDIGIKDKELIHRVGNKNKHSSTLEHLVYTFDIDGISRACLQEVARHRHTSISVKSTRYTLKELKTSNDLQSFLVPSGNPLVDNVNIDLLEAVKDSLDRGHSNDRTKYMLPEAYKTSLVWTINARSLQNFLELRTNKSALWEIRKLAYEIYNKLPDEHKYLFTEFLYKED